MLIHPLCLHVCIAFPQDYKFTSRKKNKDEDNSYRFISTENQASNSLETTYSYSTVSLLLSFCFSSSSLHLSLFLHLHRCSLLSSVPMPSTRLNASAPYCIHCNNCLEILSSILRLIYSAHQTFTSGHPPSLCAFYIQPQSLEGKRLAGWIILVHSFFKSPGEFMWYDERKVSNSLISSSLSAIALYIKALNIIISNDDFHRDKSSQAWLKLAVSIARWWRRRPWVMTTRLWDSFTDPPS